MRNQRIAAARDVAEKLHAAEAAIDEAFARVAQLNSALPEARLAANLSATVGQEAFSRAATSMHHIAAARREMVAAHEGLLATQGDIGLARMNFGGEGNKTFTIASQGLQVVSDAA
ncbi:hypothetical protein [Novosphingopyxis sp.]|uniref:hypothetical protein n=1 Tax=Novosphingopyxis sp. TaxID=2709690 RepID=UPI003B5A6D66